MVLPVIKYKHLSDALEQANRTHYGLGGSRWSATRTVRKRSRASSSPARSGRTSTSTCRRCSRSGATSGAASASRNGKWGYNEFTQVQVVDTKR